MDLAYYKVKIGNFGDDLNLWLWEKIFADELKRKDDFVLIGIGTILFDKSQALVGLEDKKKIIFGSGIRFIDNPISIDDKWIVSFLRGPLSSYILRNNLEEYITDSAYCLALTDAYKDFMKEEKKYKISLMPHFRSTKLANWKKICKELGYHYINPHSKKGLIFTISEIAKSEYIISEAMHGAIVADILRIPWRRVKFYSHIHESEKVSEFKWTDWLRSMEITTSHSINIDELLRSPNLYRKVFLFPSVIRNRITTKMIIESLKKGNNDMIYNLSNEKIINQKINKLNDKITQVKNIIKS